MIQSIRALTDAGFVVDTARNGFIGLNKMLSSTFPNTPTCFSTAPTPAPAPAPTAASAPVAVTVAVTVTVIADPKSIAVEIVSNESCTKNDNTNTNTSTNDVISQGVESNDKTTGTGAGTGMGSKHLVVDTTSASVGGTTVAVVSPEVIKPFDYVLMDIQMPVMGKGLRDKLFVVSWHKYLILHHAIFVMLCYVTLCHVMSCHIRSCHILSYYIMS